MRKLVWTAIGTVTILLAVGASAYAHKLDWQTVGNALDRAALEDLGADRPHHSRMN